MNSLHSLARLLVLGILAVLLIVGLVVAWWIAVVAVFLVGAWFTVRRMLGGNLFPAAAAGGVAVERAEDQPAPHNPVVIEGEFREVTRDDSAGGR